MAVCGMRKKEPSIRRTTPLPRTAPPVGSPTTFPNRHFMMCQPLRGWRHVRVTARRTRCGYAECVRELVEVHYPRAEKTRLVQDNLSTHSGGRLYEAFAPETARRILDRIEFHYTPKHGSWLNMAETGSEHWKRKSALRSSRTMKTMELW
jgi:hypothetical protein